MKEQRESTELNIQGEGTPRYIYIILDFYFKAGGCIFISLHPSTLDAVQDMILALCNFFISLVGNQRVTNT